MVVECAFSGAHPIKGLVKQRTSRMQRNADAEAALQKQHDNDVLATLLGKSGNRK